MAFGMVIAAGWTFIVITVSLVSVWFLPLIFVATVVGAFLPDLDSDTSVLLKILLIIFSVLGSAVAGWIVFNQEDSSWLRLGGMSAFSGLFIYYGIGGIFKKLTNHRGIFHSIPAVLLSAMLTLTLLNQIDLDVNIKIIISLSVGFGYLCHLILDELNSTVNLGGIPFIPNKSIGTALKLYSKNWKISLGVYVITGWLLFQNWETIMNFIGEF